MRAGDIVAASDPRQPGRSVLKRVADVGPDGLFLLGDNPEHSTDSRHFGWVPITSVQGKAVYRDAPPARAGRLAQPDLAQPDLANPISVKPGWTEHP